MNTRTDDDARSKVWEMIKDIKVAMMVTHADGEDMRARPMVAQQDKFEGELWFATSLHSGKTEQLGHNGEVLLTYADISSSSYVAVSGRAEIVSDRAKVKELWSETLRIWFPAGPEDPNLGLIKVTVEGAEYWDSSSSSMKFAYGYAKARLTGEAPRLGENEKVDFA
jgi:general stress protein 26